MNEINVIAGEIVDDGRSANVSGSALLKVLIIGRDFLSLGSRSLHCPNF